MPVNKQTDLELSHDWTRATCDPQRKKYVYRCTACLAWATRDDAETSECRGQTRHMAAVRKQATSAGHQIIELRPRCDRQGAPPLIICVQCGKYATTSPQSLLTVCPRGAEGYCCTSINRALKGMHPKHRGVGSAILYEAG